MPTTIKNTTNPICAYTTSRLVNVSPQMALNVILFFAIQSSNLFFITLLFLVSLAPCDFLQGFLPSWVDSNHRPSLATGDIFLRRMPSGIVSALLSALYQLSYTMKSLLSQGFSFMYIKTPTCPRQPGSILSRPSIGVLRLAVSREKKFISNLACECSRLLLSMLLYLSNRQVLNASYPSAKPP